MKSISNLIKANKGKLGVFGGLSLIVTGIILGSTCKDFFVNFFAGGDTTSTIATYSTMFGVILLGSILGLFKHFFFTPQRKLAKQQLKDAKDKAKKERKEEREQAKKELKETPKNDIIIKEEK